MLRMMSFFCFFFRMVSFWSLFCSVFNWVVIWDCGSWRIGICIFFGRLFRDLLWGMYVGGVLGVLVILRMVFVFIKVVLCCVDCIIGIILVICICMFYC